MAAWNSGTTFWELRIVYGFILEFKMLSALGKPGERITN